MAESKLAMNKKKFVEPTSEIQTINYDTFSKQIDPEIMDIVALARTLGVAQTDNDELDYNIGLNFDWSQQSFRVRIIQKLSVRYFLYIL